MKCLTSVMAVGFLLLAMPGAAQKKNPEPPAAKPAKEVYELIREGNISEALRLSSDSANARESALKRLIEIADIEMLERQVALAQSTLDNAEKFLAACDQSGANIGTLRDPISGRQSRLRGIKLNDSKDYRGAETELRRALEISLKIKDARLEAGVHNNLGVAIQAQGRLEDAKAEYEAAIRIAVQQRDFFRAGSSSYNLGNLHIQKNQLPAALDSFKVAEAQFKLASKSLQQAHAILLQAVIQDRMSAPDPEVIMSFDRAFKMFEQVGDVLSAGRSLYLLGDHLARSQKYAEAAARVERAIPFFKATQDDVSLQKCYELLADTYDKTGQKEKAEGYRKSAREKKVN